MCSHYSVLTAANLLHVVLLWDKNIKDKQLSTTQRCLDAKSNPDLYSHLYEYL